MDKAEKPLIPASGEVANADGGDMPRPLRGVPAATGVGRS